ncbi:HAMP domain-containing sensor histidine kinase [Saccharopolyspora spinosa]|uniref:Signal transduction histidine-protein kinase/phosphatase MprB n=1 Tax=Saccharopolyspora spinosa TaxID=60894 RepID=A0A2N3XXM9_SACSN|nr:HAMP domain-containing sensor histidine kinase [Saccharopolyspora spinosa]PKW15426.1 signal transduction histidine kinase [Saccharopolyspora spinosa]
MRRRIVALTVLAAVLAIGLFGLPLAAAVAGYYLEDERAELERAAEAAALSVADELIRDQRPLQLPPAQPQTRLALYSPTGQFDTGNGPAEADAAVIAAQRGDVATGSAGDDLVVAVPIADNGTVVGVVRAATPHSEVYLRTAVTWLVMVGLSVLAVAAAWLMARGMARRLTRPLDELSHAAQQLGEGDFTVRTSRAGIPEIDSVASAMETTAHRLGEILARERAFSANASHQLRTPLAGLRLQLEAALDSRDADLRPAIQASIDAADRLERTIDDLLLLARTSGSASAPADLDELLAEVRESWDGLLAAQGRELLVSPPGAARPNASAAAIRQVLAVLLDNAATHGTGTVTVTARDAGDVLAIDVSDEGAGIDAGVDPFAQRREGGGRGIGLALARGLAEGEGGRLWLRKPVPPTFTLLLPIAESPDP